MKKIPLSGKNGRDRFALVDDADYEFLMQWKWHVKISSNNCYACRTSYALGYRKDYLMHRVILNTPDKMDCDHIDHNTLNNTRANLRNCSHQDNMKNMSKHKDSYSKYLGVGYIRASGKWRARLFHDGKEIRLGHFATEEAAARAYDNVIKSYKGEFAMFNFPK